MVSAQDLRDARGRISASGVAYVISVRFEALGSRDTPATVFEPMSIDKYDVEVAAVFQRFLGKGGGLWSKHTSSRAIQFHLVQYRVRKPTFRIIGNFGTPIGLTIEHEILTCLGRMVRQLDKVASDIAGFSVKTSATWNPGPDLMINGVRELDSKSSAEWRIDRLSQHHRDLSNRALVLGSVLAILLLVAIGVNIYSSLQLALLLYAYCVLLFIGVVVLRLRASSAAADAEAGRGQLDLQELMSEPREHRAQKMYQVHSQQLKRYYDQALQQRALIFATGLLSILAGFSIIGVALWLLVTVSSNNTVTIIIGVLGAVGGILGNFIAIVYLRMFTETLKSVGSFHNRLVTTHHLHFANFLIAKVTSDSMRNNFLGELALLAASQERLEGEGDDARASQMKSTSETQGSDTDDS